MKKKKKSVSYYRLFKLAAFLEELPPQKFNFGEVVASFDHKNQCGSVCCAIGWTPAIWPKKVKWGNTEIDGMGDEYIPLVSCENNKKYDYASVAQRLFGISKDHAYQLFQPSMIDSPWQDHRIKLLTDEAHPKDVAKNIRWYIKWHKKKYKAK